MSGDGLVKRGGKREETEKELGVETKLGMVKTMGMERLASALVADVGGCGEPPSQANSGVSADPAVLRYGPSAGLGLLSEVARVSFGLNHEVLPGKDDALPYLNLPPNGPPLPWDLNVGWDKEEWVKDMVDRFNMNCRTLEWVSNCFPDGNLPKGVNIACGRCCILRLGKTPYCRDSWRLAIVRHKDILFIVHLERPQDVIREDDEHKQASYRGLRIAQFLTADKDGNSEAEKDLRYCGGSYRIIKRRLGSGPNSHVLLYSGRLDAYDRERGQYVCVKLKNTFHGFMSSARTLGWWLMANLLGNARIVCGVRNEAGTALHVEEWTPRELEEVASPRPGSRPGSSKGWDAQIALRFTAACFSLIRDTVTENDVTQAWVLEHREGDYFVPPPRRLEEAENAEVLAEIVPDLFLKTFA